MNPCPFPLDVSRSSRFLHYYYFCPHISLSLSLPFSSFFANNAGLVLPTCTPTCLIWTVYRLPTSSPAQTGFLPAAATLTAFPHYRPAYYTFTTKTTGRLLRVDPTSSSLVPSMSRSSHGCCSKRHLAYSPCPFPPPAYQHPGQPEIQVRLRFTSGLGVGSYLT